jgi:hypothetical protein
MNQLEGPPINPVRAEAINVAALPGAAHSGNAPLDELFPQEEWNQLCSQDKLAATAIVAIMITIFSLGLIGYLAIALVCMGK